MHSFYWNVLLLLLLLLFIFHNKRLSLCGSLLNLPVPDQVRVSFLKIIEIKLNKTWLFDFHVTFTWNSLVKLILLAPALVNFDASCHQKCSLRKKIKLGHCRPPSDDAAETSRITLEPSDSEKSWLAAQDCVGGLLAQRLLVLGIRHDRIRHRMFRWLSDGCG